MKKIAGGAGLPPALLSLLGAIHAETNVGNGSEPCRRDNLVALVATGFAVAVVRTGLHAGERGAGGGYGRSPVQRFRRLGLIHEVSHGLSP